MAQLRFKCKFCDQQGLVWRQVEGKFRPWDELTNREHTCAAVSFNTSTQPTAPVAVQSAGGDVSETLAVVLEMLHAVPEAAAKEARTIATQLLGEARQAVKGELDANRDLAVSRALAKVDEYLKNNVTVTHMHQLQMPDGTVKGLGQVHEKLPLLIQVLSQRVHCMLVGPAGSGKTTAAHQAADALGLAYHEAAMGPSKSEWDLLGYRSPEGRYVPGVLRQPYEQGGLLMVDEIDNANPSVLTAMNSAIANTQTAFPDGIVKRHADFVLVAAGNTFGRGADRLYVGRNQLDAATLDRFANINWEYDEVAEGHWAGLDQIQWVKYVQQVRAVIYKHKLRLIVSPRASINGARLLRAGLDRQSVEELVVWKGMTSDERARITADLKVGK